MNIRAISKPLNLMEDANVRDYIFIANTRKQYFLTMLFAFTSILFLAIFGLISISQNNLTLGGVCFLGLFLNVGNLIVLQFTGKYKLACLIIVILMIGLTLYLVCSGGANNTGPLWFYVMPILIFYVLELKKGLITLITLELIITIILLFPDNPFLSTNYDTAFIIRFLASLFAVTLLAFAYEFSRKDWQKEFTILNTLLEEKSRTDELTGLTNRRDMNSRLKEELARFKQNNRPFSLIMCDIDHFKQINDQYGHDCGDRVLIEVSHTMEQGIKQQDRVSRWGGEEFLLLLPETHLENSRKVAERLRQTIENLIVHYEGEQVTLTMSFGTVEYNGEQEMLACLKEADKRLYLSKQRGRNCIT